MLEHRSDGVRAMHVAARETAGVPLTGEEERETKRKWGRKQRKEEKKRKMGKGGRGKMGKKEKEKGKQRKREQKENKKRTKRERKEKRASNKAWQDVLRKRAEARERAKGGNLRQG